MYIRNKEIYGWPPEDEWTRGHIQSCGSLGQRYPNRLWVTEGDSPSFLYVYTNGLNVPDSLDYGGWGGRFAKEKTSGIQGMDFIEKSGKDETQYAPYHMHASTPEGIQNIRRWRQHIWNNFATRMQWTVAERLEDANHHPTAVVDGDHSLRCIHIKAQAGETLSFDASASTDRDGDSLTYQWSVYAEPSTYQETVVVEDASQPECRIKLPQDASGKTIHLILEVTDNGTPRLTAYRRVVVTVK